MINGVTILSYVSQLIVHLMKGHLRYWVGRYLCVYLHACSIERSEVIAKL